MKDSLKMHWAGCIGELSKVKVKKEMLLVREEALAWSVWRGWGLSGWDL